MEQSAGSFNQILGLQLRGELIVLHSRAVKWRYPSPKEVSEHGWRSEDILAIAVKYVDEQIQPFKDEVFTMYGSDRYNLHIAIRGDEQVPAVANPDEVTPLEMVQYAVIDMMALALKTPNNTMQFARSDNMPYECELYRHWHTLTRRKPKEIHPFHPMFKLAKVDRELSSGSYDASYCPSCGKLMVDCQGRC